MRRNSLVPHVALAVALGLAAAATRAQQQPAAQGDEGGPVRGAFRNTRPGAKRAEKKEAKEADAKPGAAQREQQNGADGGGVMARERTKRDPNLKAVKSPPWTPEEVKPTAPAASGPLLTPASAEEKSPGIALGYTLFMRAPTGEAKRVSATRAFKSGDSVRLLIETNSGIL